MGIKIPQRGFRLIIVFIILFVIDNLSNFSYSQQAQITATETLNQKVSISANSITLDKVFEQLSVQTGYYFTYDADLINGDKLVNLQIDNISVVEILDSLLQNPNLNYEKVYNQIVIYLDKENNTTSENIVTYKYYTGKVVDASSSIALPFSSVSIKNSYFGGITNETGNFSIKIPEAFFNDTLVFSYMGYYNSEIAISDFIDSQIIKLNSGIVSLQEVIIRSADPLQLLRKSRKLLSTNYFENHYSFQAFYREAVKRSSDYMIYSEALIKGYKPSLNSLNTNSRVQLIKGRKFSNIQQSDTILVKLRGGMDACFQLDVIRQLPDFLTEDGEYNYQYSISDIIIWHNELVYVIDFKPRSSSSPSMFKGSIYMSVNSYAIIGTDFSFINKRISKSGNMFVFKKSRKIRVIPVNTQYQIEYAKWNNRYYAKYVRGELTIKVKKRRHFFRENYTTFMEMVYTQINTDNVEKLAYSNQFHTNTVFSDSEYLYNYDFWNENNIISPEKDIMDAFKNSGFILEKTDVR